MAKPRRKHPRTKLLAECPDGERFLTAMQKALGENISYEPLGYMRPDRVHVFDFDGSLGRGILFEVDRIEDGEPQREWHFAQRRIGVDVRGTWIIDLISAGSDSTFYEHFEPADDDDLPPTLFADFNCYACARLAAMVAHVPPGESLPALGTARQPDFVETSRVAVWFGDELYYCVSDDESPSYDAARAAIGARDALGVFLADPAFAPFFCSECAVVYCPAHWDGTGPATSCPRDHMRQLAR